MDELFEILDENGEPAGVVPRAQVHTEGFWHRAVHVWLFDLRGCVLLQRRGPNKDINPNLWDVSVGEHLIPGETYSEAAYRGVQEELSIRVDVLEPLGGERRVAFDWPQLGIHDHECQQAFRGVTDAAVTAESTEIAELRWLWPNELCAWLSTEPEAFTQGCVRDISELNLLSSVQADR